jgi:NAD(P)-dependent dehydrogenase (short-subunit alcohol dehydrogenase family)
LLTYRRTKLRRSLVDVCREDDVANMVATAHKAFGRVDCLFNNAGFGGVSGNIEDTDMGEPYQRTVDAMLTGWNRHSDIFWPAGIGR